MKTPSAAVLLDLWEAGLVRPRWSWADAMVRAADPALTAESVGELTIGQRDERLLRLREALFGPKIEARSDCLRCRQPVEFDADIPALIASALTPTPSSSTHAKPADEPPFAVRNTNSEQERRGVRNTNPEPERVGEAVARELAGVRNTNSESGRVSVRDANTERSGVVEGWRVVEGSGAVRRFRVPTVRDVAFAAGAGGEHGMRAALLRRCVKLPEERDDRAPEEEPTASALTEVLDAMAAADPLADICFDLQCPACAHRWSQRFDIVSFLWAEVEVWAQRLIDDIHRLASAYGWRESDILALSPQRRAGYLERIGA